MFYRAINGGGGSGGKVYTKRVSEALSVGNNTKTFSDFEEIYAIRLSDGNYVTAYLDENGVLQNEGGYKGALTATSISGNTVVISVASGYASNYTFTITGR